MLSAKTQVLNKLDDTLDKFLRAYAVKRLNHLTAENKIENLREISFSNKPEYQDMDKRLVALENWFNQYSTDITRDQLNNEVIQQLIDCVKQIEIIGRGDSAEGSSANEILFDRKRALRVANLANDFLNKVTGKIKEQPAPRSLRIVRSSEENSLPDSAGISGGMVKDKFTDSLAYQMQVMESYKNDKYHLFSIVDKLFDRLEKSPDVKASHMAASILYFMKLSGYKTAPYVEKLRKLNRNRND